MNTSCSIIFTLCLFTTSLWAQGQSISKSSNWQLGLVGTFIIEDAEAISEVIQSELQISSYRPVYGIGLEYQLHDLFLNVNYSAGTSTQSSSLEKLIIGSALYGINMGYSWYLWGEESVGLSPFVGYTFRTMRFTSVLNGNGGTTVPIQTAYHAHYSDSFGILGLRFDTYTRKFGDAFLLPARVGVIFSASESLNQASWEGHLQNGSKSNYLIINRFWSLTAVISWDL